MYKPVYYRSTTQIGQALPAGTVVSALEIKRIHSGMESWITSVGHESCPLKFIDAADLTGVRTGAGFPPDVDQLKKDAIDRLSRDNAALLDASKKSASEVAKLLMKAIDAASTLERQLLPEGQRAKAFGGGEYAAYTQVGFERDYIRFELDIWYDQIRATSVIVKREAAKLDSVDLDPLYNYVDGLSLDEVPSGKAREGRNCVEMLMHRFEAEDHKRSFWGLRERVVEDFLSDTSGKIVSAAFVGLGIILAALGWLALELTKHLLHAR